MRAMRRMRNVCVNLCVCVSAFEWVRMPLCVRVRVRVRVSVSVSVYACSLLCYVMLNPFEKLSNPIRSCRSIKVF